MLNLTQLAGFGAMGGKQIINLTISANTQQYDIFSAAGSPAGAVDVSLTINSGVIVGDVSAGTYAVRTGSAWAAGSTIAIVNNGTIQGIGGNGGSANDGAGTGDAGAVVAPDASTTVKGIVELATSAEAIAGTDAVRAITPATLFGGLNASGSAPIFACRAWVNFNGTGTVAIRASGNVSSITDNGVGDYTVKFTTALPDANYAVSGITTQSVNNSNQASVLIYGADAGATTKTSTALRIGTARPHTATAPYDCSEVSIAVFR